MRCRSVWETVGSRLRGENVETSSKDTFKSREARIVCGDKEAWALQSPI